jgi:hypothetical protein
MIAGLLSVRSMHPTVKRNPTATVCEVMFATVQAMKTRTESMRVGAQKTLDELFAESLIPFALSARVVDFVGLEEYILRFGDVRLQSVDVSCPEGQSFNDMVRTAVLDRVSRLVKSGHAAAR